MALFKIFKGNRDSLNDMPMHDGYAYFCMDDGTFHIDYADTNNTLSRKQINASEAEKLIGFDVSTVLNPTDIEIPTSNAVYKVWETTDSEVSAIKDEIDETCKSGTSESKTVMRFDDVEPDSEVNLTWSGNAQTKEFEIKGKNLIGMNYSIGDSGSFNYSSGSWEIQEDGGIKLSGEIGNGDVLEELGYFTLPAGTYTLSGIPYVPILEKIPYIYFWEDEVYGHAPFAYLPSDEDIGELSYKTTFTLDHETTICWQIQFSEADSYDYSGFVIYPQVELGETATSYENWTIGRTETVTKGSTVSLYSPTSTIFPTDDSAFSVETKLGLKPSIISYIDDSADEVLKIAKNYTDKELAEFDFIKVVDALPSPGLPNRIYLVPKDSEEQADSPGVNKYDFFDEYIWKPTASGKDGTWEWITTKQFEIDLTEYVKLSKVEELILARSKKDHPVNSIYITTTNTNPNSILGFGTWSLIAKDRMLIGAGNKYKAGATGGAETVALTTTQVPKVEGQIGIHGGTTATNIHTTQGCFSAGITNTNKYINTGTGTTGANSIGQIRFSNGGTGAAHNNMPPYYAVYFWKRTA